MLAARTLIIISVFFPRISNAQWTSVNVGTSSNLSCVDYTSAQQIIIGGAGRTVISTDGGSTWNTQLLLDTFGNNISGSHVYDLYPIAGSTYNLCGQFFAGNNQCIFRSHNNASGCYLTYINNNGTNPKLFWDSDFTGGTIGYATGTHGRIVKTTDAGLTWTLQSTPTTAELYGIDFVNPSIGTAVGNLSIVHTTNGGITWTAQTTPWYLRSVHFPTANVGYACGADGTYGTIVKSTDGGATWNPLPICNLQVNATFNEIWFTSQDTGYAVSGAVIYKTVDGGQTWTFTVVNGAGNLRSIHFLDANNGFAVGENGTVFRTTNGGGMYQGIPIGGFTTSMVAACGNTQVNATNITGGSYTTQWLLNNVPYSSSYNTSFSFSSTTTATITLIVSNACCSDTVTSVITANVQQPNPVVAVPDQNFCGTAVQLSASPTGSFSWSPVAGLSNPSIGNPLASPSVTTTYTVTLTSGSCVSSDQVVVTVYPLITNEIWDPDTMPISSADAVTAVHFIDANHGFAMQSGGIHKTVNGGTTWTNSYLNSMGLNQGCISFTSYTDGWVAAGRLLQTINAGTSWTVNPLTGISFNVGTDQVADVFFTDSLTGYILINNTSNTTRIAKTINGGLTWGQCYSNTNERLLSIYGVTSDTVYCTGTSVPMPTTIRAYKTVNGGTSWQPLTITAPTGIVIKEVEFLDSDYGYIVGVNYLFQTLDGGATWTTFNVPNALCVEIINRDTVFVGCGNHIYKTFSGGACWSDMGIQTPNYVWDFSFPRREYVTGYFGTASDFVASLAVVRKTVLTSAPYLDFTLDDSVCYANQLTAYNGSVGYQSYQWFIDNVFVSSNPDYSTTLPQGIYQVMLVGSNAMGSDTLTQTLSVVGTPVVTLALSDTLLCTSSSPVTLSGGTPSGGIYSGPGVMNGIFNPAATGAGIFAITYTAGISTCTASSVDSIEVVTAPTSSLVVIDSILCYPHSVVNLTGGSPVGGVYSGVAVSNGIFDPMISGPGSFEITYTTTNGVCSTISSDTVDVIATPVASLQLTDTLVCQLPGVYTLTGGSPVGGNYGGPGVSSGTFDPMAAGSGIITITYTAASGMCSSSATDSIAVVSPPAVSLALTDSIVCYVASSYTLSGGLPSGGIYSGPGVTNGIFDPMATGPGVFAIIYTVVSPPCTVASTDSIVVDICSSISSDISTQSLVIAPNPSTGIFLAKNQSDKTMNYLIEDINGNVVYSGAIMSNDDVEIDLSDADAGMYFLRISNQENNFVYKIIKL